MSADQLETLEATFRAWERAFEQLADLQGQQLRPGHQHSDQFARRLADATAIEAAARSAMNTARREAAAAFGGTP